MADAESKLQQADEVVRKLLEYSQQEWKVVKRSSGVVVSCQSVAAYDEKVYKGEGELDAPPGQVLHYVTPGNNLPRKQWDSTTKVKQYSIVVPGSQVIVYTRNGET
jgi:hypothetical protein